MCTMSIHADEDFALALRAYAEKVGKSVNRTVQDLLSPILGLTASDGAAENPYLGFCGVLPREECAALRKSVEAQRKIDAGLWK